MKKMNKKGFTLAELLIVIAIMAILIAIAIPVFSAQLEKARESVDDGNLRSAMSLATADYLLENKTGPTVYNVVYDEGTKNLSVVDSTEDSAPDANLSPKSKKYTATPLTVTINEGKVTTTSWGTFTAPTAD